MSVVVRLISSPIGSIATNGSSYFPASGPMRTNASIIAAYFQNGTTSSATSGTTTGSSASFVLYKNASSAGSVIGTFNGSGTNVATLGSAIILTSGTSGTANSTLGVGDQIIGEVRGGAANNGSQSGAFFVIDIQYLV